MGKGSAGQEDCTVPCEAMVREASCVVAPTMSRGSSTDHWRCAFNLLLVVAPRMHKSMSFNFGKWRQAVHEATVSRHRDEALHARQSHAELQVCHGLGLRCKFPTLGTEVNAASQLPVVVGFHRSFAWTVWYVHHGPIVQAAHSALHSTMSFRIAALESETSAMTEHARAIQTQAESAVAAARQEAVELRRRCV